MNTVKRVTAQPTRTVNLSNESELVFKQGQSLWQIYWKTKGIYFYVEQITGVFARNPHALMKIRDVYRKIYYGNVFLNDSNDRARVSAYCYRIYSPIKESEWMHILQIIAEYILENTRKCTDAKLIDGENVAPTQYMLYPYLLKNQPNTFIADGATGKGMFATALALSMSCETPSIVPKTKRHGPPTTVLYLDYESCYEELQERVAMFRNGHGIGIPNLYYISMNAPITRSYHYLQKMVDKHNAQLVIIDSIGPACGTNLNDSEGPTEMFNTLRNLKYKTPENTYETCTTMLIGHVNKEDASGASNLIKPYGSSFFFFLTRSLWYLHRSQENNRGEIVIGIYHMKANRGQEVKPNAIRLSFSREGLQDKANIEPVQLSDYHDLLKKLPLRKQIGAILEKGPALLSHIVETTEEKENVIRAMMNRMEKRGEVYRYENGGEYLYAISEDQAPT